MLSFVSEKEKIKYMLKIWILTHKSTFQAGTILIPTTNHCYHYILKDVLGKDSTSLLEKKLDYLSLKVKELFLPITWFITN